MGIHGNSNNKKRTRISSRKLGKIKRVAQKQKSKLVGEIMDPDLITEAHLRKRRTSQRANITLSGKKKRKLMKQIKRLDKKKHVMEVDTSTDASGSSNRNIEMSNVGKTNGKITNERGSITSTND